MPKLLASAVSLVLKAKNVSRSARISFRVKWSTVVLKGQRTRVPVGSSWNDIQAHLCGDGGYARVEVSLDVFRLHRIGVQSNSSAQCNNFNTALV